MFKDGVVAHQRGDYIMGDGVPKDVSEAEKWLRKAAKQDFAKAQHNLSIAYVLAKASRRTMPRC